MAPKPRCTLPRGDDGKLLVLSVPFRVRDALQRAGRDKQVREFFRRLRRCSSPDLLLRLAREYVELA